MRLPRPPSALLPSTALASLGVAGVGCAIVVALVTGQGGGPLGTEPGPPTDLTHVLAGAGAGALVVMAHGLWRGSRRAAALVGAMLVALGVAGVATGDHLVVSALAVAAAGALLASHRAFRVGAAWSGVRAPALITAACVAGAWVVATASLLSADKVKGLGAGGVAAAGWLGEGSWWLGSSTPVALGLDVLWIVALCAGALFLRRLLRPGAAADGHTPAEHARAAAIVGMHATDSLAPFALREDKSFFFAHGGVLAFRTLRGTAVVSGDPIGPAGTAPSILAEFEAEAAARGWDVVVAGAGERHLDGYRSQGFQAVCIGEEAVVEPATFSLAGGSMKALRHSVTRQGRRGWSIEAVHGSDLDESTTEELATVERAWRESQRRLTGFAMTLGRLWGAEEDARSLYILGRDPEHRIRAFLRFAEYRDGLSLDVMRRIGKSPNGLTDAMVVSAIEHARTHGLDAVSLNFAGFAHVMTPGRPLTRAQRVARWLLARTHGRFQLERLAAFNKKFRPRWERRYLVHRGPQRLPVLGLRVLQAEAYVRPPRSRRLTARWEPLAFPVGSPAPRPRQAP